MANIKNTIEALQIIIKYDPKAILTARQEVLHVWPHGDDGPEIKVSPEDAKKLKKLGWEPDFNEYNEGAWGTNVS